MHEKNIIELKPDEHVFAVLREHPLSHAPRLLFYFLWVVIPFFFLFPLFAQGTIGIIIFFALTLSGFLAGLRRWIMWKQSVFVITDRRVLDVEQRGFFDRVHSDVSYAEIEDINFRVKGIIPTVFRYGTIMIHTAGSAPDIEVRRVHHPARYHDLLHDVWREGVTDLQTVRNYGNRPIP